MNETLLDLTALKESVDKALGGWPELLPLWFTTMLQYSLSWDTSADEVKRPYPGEPIRPK